MILCTTDPTIFNEMQRRLAHAARQASEITGEGVDQLALIASAWCSVDRPESSA